MVLKGYLKVDSIDLKLFGLGKKKQVDDAPFGNSSGMLLRADVVAKALYSIENLDDYLLIYLDPKGKQVTQNNLINLEAEHSKFLFISGFYEGIDERVFEAFDILRLSIGPYVISSGDLAAMVLAEGLVRLNQHYVKNNQPIQTDTFLSGLLEPRRYTRPQDYNGYTVPKVLLSGHHQQISHWNIKDALTQTLCLNANLLLQFEKKCDNVLVADILKELSRESVN